MPYEQIVAWKAIVYHMLGNVDFVTYDGEMARKVKLSEFSSIDFHGVLGDKDWVASYYRNEIKTATERGDHLSLCAFYLSEVWSLATMGEFAEATEKLIKLNNNYPAFGDYGFVFVSPFFDRIKAEYPPFMEAVNNLKLPEKVVLDDVLIRR